MPNWKSSEEYVVIRTLASPLTNEYGSRVGAPEWARTEEGRGLEEERRLVKLWLKEKRDNKDRVRRRNNRRDWATFWIVIAGVVVGLVGLLK